MNLNSHLTRRQVLGASIATAGAAFAPSRSGFADDTNRSVSHAAAPIADRLRGAAEHVISIWLGGGMGQIDTFDPKAMGDPAAKKPGSYYQQIETSVAGVSLCQHLPQLAQRMERVTAVRSVHHEMIDEHAAATNRMHTGRPISGTVTYPSLGSLIAHERGAIADNAPPYVIIGYPNVTRGPGFLGAQHGFLYLTDTSRGPMGLSRADGITADRQRRRESFLAAMRQQGRQVANANVQQYEEVIDKSLKMSGPSFNRVFELDGEPDELRNRYGGEFGQRCLLSRRLVEQGVRFVEVSHNLNFLNGAGWDVHNSGIVEQHKLISELDSAVSTLMDDLQSKGLLEKTLIMITTEFGRPPEFDSGGGRGHQGTAFSCVLAGGGLRHQGAWGETDHLAKQIVADPVGVPDLFATVCACVGVDYQKSLYDGDRPVPITDRGRPISKLFA